MNDVILPPADIHEDALAGRMMRLASAAVRGLSPRQTHGFWRNLVDRFPEEPVYAIRYASQLLLTESWEDLEAVTDWAGRYSSPELDLCLIDAALARADVDGCQSRLRRFLDTHGNSPALRVREHNLHLLQGDYDAAAAVAAELAALVPGERARAAYLADRARYLRELSDSWSRHDRERRDFDIYVINLDADTVRLERMVKQLRGAAFTRIPGVKGAQLPELALMSLTRGRGGMQKGTVGCFLSHLVAWERVAATGRPALVLEDDAWLLAGVPPSTAALELPAGFDVVFANERMTPDSPLFPRRSLITVPLGAAARTKGAGWSSVGTEGYFVSPKGAKKLLSLVKRDGIAGDVDWRLLSYALTERQTKPLRAAGGFAAKALKFHELQRSGPGRIKASVLSPAIICQFAGGSVRLWDNDMPHSHMAVTKSLMAQRRGV